MKESEYQSVIIDYLQILENRGKLWFQRTNNNTIYDPSKQIHRKLAKGQKKGFPDIVVFINSKTIALEVKTPIGKQSKEQKLMEQKLKEQGISYHIVTTIEDVKKVIGL